MRSGQQHRGSGGARSAPIIPANKQESNNAFSTPAPWAAALHRLRVVGPWIATVAAIVILGTVMLMLVDTGRISAGAPRDVAQPTPTATPSPTPFPNTTPLPTPQSGFKLYADTN